MRNAFSLLQSLVLVACLAIYGPANMAQAGSGGAVFSMVICTNGVSKIVQMGADGVPVNPAKTCPDCLFCCNATGPQPQLGCTAFVCRILMKMQVDGPSLQNPIFDKRNTLPVPRGPPVASFTALSVPDLIGLKQPIIGSKNHSDGRPLFKDADA